uniref:Uncharacterized protein n=1 Tax=Chenopodium quinoa TaxID=63459 RepID=A0A803L963_CHEQI
MGTYVKRYLQLEKMRSVKREDFNLKEIKMVMQNYLAQMKSCLTVSVPYLQDTWQAGMKYETRVRCSIVSLVTPKPILAVALQRDHPIENGIFVDAKSHRLWYMSCETDILHLFVGLHEE